MIEGCSGPVPTGAVTVVERWATSLPDEMKLEFSGSAYSDDIHVHLWAKERPPALLKPAFERANRIRAGLGWQLVRALDRIAFRHGLVMTPQSVFDMASSALWMGEQDDASFREHYVELNWMGEEPPDPAELEQLRGPDSYFDAFPGMPEELARPYRGRRRRVRDLWPAQRLMRAASRARSDWECSLLLALAAVSDFHEANAPGVWDLMSTNGYESEHGAPSYYIRWSEDDDMGYWADEVLNQLWNDGIAEESLLGFSFGSAEPKHVDQLVSTIEACRDHRAVADQVLEVLLQAEEEDGIDIQ